jgi:hypothetical protein
MGDTATDKELLAYNSLIAHYYRFLRIYKLNPQLYGIDHYTLKDIIKRYMRDVDRLHHFHDMPRISSTKIAGYMAYWICKLRPISATGGRIYFETPDVPKFINENFAVYVALGRVNSGMGKTLARGITISAAVYSALLYSLRYRHLSGDALSLIFDMAVLKAVSK